MNCLSNSITNSLDHAYAHHIQRLMVTGNFASLLGVHPDEVDRWYLGVYIDAFEWVEITNTRGMSQFADGGIVGSISSISISSIEANPFNPRTNFEKAALEELSSSIKALKKLNLENTIAILGIAKRLEEIFYPNDPIPLYLNKKSETLKVIQQMRNEAHRFAINFHRNKRSKQALTSSFDRIPGIGEKTKTALLKRFKSLKNIKETSLELLISEVGESKAKKLKDFLNSMS